MYRRQFIKLAGSAVSVGLAAPAIAQTPALTLKLGTVDNPASHSGVAAEAFAREAQNLSGGSLKVDVFHAGKLGTIGEQVKNVFSGVQDLHLLYPEFLTNLIDETKIIGAPYVFSDLDHLQRYHKSALFKPAVERLGSLGAVLLDPDWEWKIRDPRGLIAVRPIQTPADLQGLKLRIWESKTAIATWRGLGANTIVVPRPEMYLAFKQGIIEGGPETIGLALDQKNVELAKFWTRTEEYHQIINVMMNKGRFDRLDTKQKEALAGAAVAGGKAMGAESMRGFTEKRGIAEKNFGVKVLEPDLKPWREKARGILEAMEQDGTIPKGAVTKAMTV
jgi:TRAP-type C4-dicarboxylate transport system substrate-binding protein